MNRSKNLEIVVLNEISQSVLREKKVPVLFRNVLDILYREMGLLRGTLTLRNGDNLFIEASHGLSEEEIKRGKYKLGEGVTGQVAAKAQPMVIPDISKSPEFLNRTGTRKKEPDIAFICVPILYQEEVIGTLSIDRKVSPQTDLDRDLNLLEIVANLLAEAVYTLQREHDERALLIDENYRLKQELELTPRPAEIIGNCQAMRSIYTMIAQVADSSATVLILGSSGTGKELVARAIQKASGRASRPFVAVNCAALPENLIESELFGHEKGSFTGALSQRVGRVEAADGGTLFLDEIGDLSLAVQVKLLRFLQERSFQRVGSNTLRYADVRIIAATSRNLEKLMSEGKFREDLYYRLNVFPIHLPDLSKRKSDIILLAEHFLAKYNRKHNRNIKRISTPAVNLMMAYHWPGNVRELENCIERALLTADNDVICAYNLPPSLQTATTGGKAMPGESEDAGLEILVNSFERELIVAALKANRGNVAAAARRLKTSCRILHYKIGKLNINPSWYKN